MDKPFVNTCICNFCKCLILFITFVWKNECKILITIFYLLKKHDILTIAQRMLNFRPKLVSFEVKHTFSVLRLTQVRLSNNIMLIKP